MQVDPGAGSNATGASRVPPFGALLVALDHDTVLLEQANVDTVELTS